MVKLESGEHQKIPVPAGARSLADALAAHGLPLDTRCGERGFCRGCEVDLRAGLLTVVGVGFTALATGQACRARASGPAHILIPARSRIEHKPQVGETFEIVIPYAHRPLFMPVAGKRDMAFAVDVGTTTVVLLVDLVSGEVLSRAGASQNFSSAVDASLLPNAQSYFAHITSPWPLPIPLNGSLALRPNQ